MKNLDLKSTAGGKITVNERTNDEQKEGSRISAHKLFGFFTAGIIKKRVKFTR